MNRKCAKCFSCVTTFNTWTQPCEVGCFLLHQFTDEESEDQRMKEMTRLPQGHTMAQLVFESRLDPEVHTLNKLLCVASCVRLVSKPHSGRAKLSCFSLQAGQNPSSSLRCDRLHPDSDCAPGSLLCLALLSQLLLRELICPSRSHMRWGDVTSSSCFLCPRPFCSDA